MREVCTLLLLAAFFLVMTFLSYSIGLGSDTVSPAWQVSTLDLFLIAVAILPLLGIIWLYRPQIAARGKVHRSSYDDGVVGIKSD